MITVSTSLSSRNERGNTGLHNGIKPDPELDSFANLPHGLFRKGGDFKVLLDPAGGLRGGQEGRPALDGPGEQDLRLDRGSGTGPILLSQATFLLAHIQ